LVSRLGNFYEKLRADSRLNCGAVVGSIEHDGLDIVLRHGEDETEFNWSQSVQIDSLGAI